MFRIITSMTLSITALIFMAFTLYYPFYQFPYVDGFPEASYPSGLGCAEQPDDMSQECVSLWLVSCKPIFLPLT